MEVKMADIKSNIEKVRSDLNDDVLLVAVTKTHSPEEINEALECGITDIGENKVQEILDKYDKVGPVRWHMIGHLQTNKVKYIIDKVVLIHSVDSLKLAKEINKRAAQADKVMDILIQVNAAHEESKWGIDPAMTGELIGQILESCPNVRIKGLMSVAPYSDDPDEIRPYFAEVKRLYDEYGKIDNEMIDFEYLSMGMTHDYVTAIEEGSNLVRVGTAIFGARVY
jgi:pyridoxal phosphate enzyme (YggS family)